MPPGPGNPGGPVAPPTQAYPAGQPAPPTQAYEGQQPPPGYPGGYPADGSGDPTVQAGPGYAGGAQYGAQPYGADPNQQPPGYGPGQGYPPPGPGYPDGGYPGGPQYPPQYPYPPAPPGNSGNGKVIGIIAAILIPILGIAAVIGVRVLRNQSHHTSTDAAADHSTSSTYSTSSPAPTTDYETPTSEYAPPPPPPPPAPADVWIAAGYNTNTGKVTWARSSVSSDDATEQVANHCPDCAKPAAWARNACVAVVVGAGNGWASTWGTTAEEAESKAVTSAQDNYGVSGPFDTWSKCTED
ncbi:DUF4189 domain-containing protein [Nocardia vermiculata]|nr:DUF4189 domain-containing protein [Nocardia vermiculata]